MKNFSICLLIILFLTCSAFAQTEAEIIVEKANKLISDNKPEEAITEISKAIAIEPDNANLYISRANFNRELDNNAEILKDAQKATSLAPTDKKVLYFAASVLKQTGQMKEALKIADELIALGDVDRFGWSLRIQIKMQIDDFIGAFEDVTTALKLFPQENMFKQDQAILIRAMGDSEKALEIYNSVIASSEKKLKETKTENEKIPIIYDLNNFYFNRAGYYLSKSNKELAQADLIKALSHSPTDFDYSRRARIYQDIKMYTEAIADLTKALEILDQADKVSILIQRGDVYVYSERYDEGLKDYQEALKLDSSIKEIYDQRMEWMKQMRNR